MKSITLIILFLFEYLYSATQNYQAIHGSSYAGSLGIGNNPSSIVSTPYKWDINLLSAQVKNSTNIITIHKYSLLSSPRQSEYQIRGGNYNRYERSNFNVNILNARISLNRRQAVAFGINIRGYGHLKTDAYNFNDTIKSSGEFFKLNEDINAFNGKLTTSSWIEIFGSYARTILDTEADRLNTGVTLKASRGISGAFARINNVQFEKNVQVNRTIYSLIRGSASYGYSSNYDKWKDNRATSENLKDFLRTSEGGIAIDAGVEYIVKTQAVTSVFDDDPYYDYEWKFGLSVLDFGVNQYKYSTRSRTVNGFRHDVTDQLLDEKFTNIESVNAFNDSLASIVNNADPISGKFYILNPVRLVTNADRNLNNDFYVNGELSLNLASIAGDSYHYVTDLNFITITPRWETSRWGIFLPVQYNIEGKLWVGGAFKAGPLLVGVHNWANVFSKKKMHNSGGYIALVIRPMDMISAKKDKRWECPE